MSDIPPPQATQQDWLLLILLSAIWGGSFFFIGVAVKELPSLLIVFARVALAALFIIPLHLILRGPLPRDPRPWIGGLGMAIMNNALPFTLITYAQHSIESGLASVLNATTPIFTVLFMAMVGFEAITPRKVLALLMGLVGVAVLRNASFSIADGQSLAILCVVGAAMCYGASGPWSKKMLSGVNPVTTASCQLIFSSLIMGVVVFFFDDVTGYTNASLQTWAALGGLAFLSTTIAYFLFFKIMNSAGASFVSLCTLIIPVFAILLGYLFLGERLSANEFIGALIIGLSLVVIDGRLLRRFGIKLA
jgi:drug/metabolite transporter (DMT)-like permease